MVTHLAAQITAKSAPKKKSVLFQKEKPIILQIYFSTKKTKKTTTTPKNTKYGF